MPSLLSDIASAGPAIDTDAWALGDAELELVLEQIDGGRTRVIECGSGWSTIAIARLLRRLGAGSVHSLEHDPEWAALGRERLAEEELRAFATIIDAPLADHPLVAPGCGWYERAALAGLPGQVDLLLVDGPPASADGPAERSRYPALPLLSDRLASGAAVILDDAGREGERWVLERWERDHGLSFERHGECAIAWSAD